jgi:hypothetical protein
VYINWLIERGIATSRAPPLVFKVSLRNIMKKNKYQKYIDSCKFLKNPKYYKNNYWQWAHSDSTNARGFGSGCSFCKSKYCNASLRNKRNTKGEGKPYNEILSELCGDCVRKIETIIDYEFKGENCD